MSFDNQHEEEKLDETLEETFPASDPHAKPVESSNRTSGSLTSSDLQISDNTDLKRFELTIDGHTAFLVYERTEHTLTLIHTEVPEPLRGHQVGDVLVEAALAAGRSQGLRIVAVCPFARAYLRRHSSR